jgi:hypothetical protein
MSVRDSHEFREYSVAETSIRRTRQAECPKHLTGAFRSQGFMEVELSHGTVTLNMYTEATVRGNAGDISTKIPHTAQSPHSRKKLEYKWIKPGAVDSKAV